MRLPGCQPANGAVLLWAAHGLQLLLLPLLLPSRRRPACPAPCPDAARQGTPSSALPTATPNYPPAAYNATHPPTQAPYPCPRLPTRAPTTPMLAGASSTTTTPHARAAADRRDDPPAGLAHRLRGDWHGHVPPQRLCLHLLCLPAPAGQRHPRPPPRHERCGCPGRLGGSAAGCSGALQAIRLRHHVLQPNKCRQAPKQAPRPRAVSLPPLLPPGSTGQGGYIGYFGPFKNPGPGQSLGLQHIEAPTETWPKVGTQSSAKVVIGKRYVSRDVLRRMAGPGAAAQQHGDGAAQFMMIPMVDTRVAHCLQAQRPPAGRRTYRLPSPPTHTYRIQTDTMHYQPSAAVAVALTRLLLAPSPPPPTYTRVHASRRLRTTSSAAPAMCTATRCGAATSTRRASSSPRTTLTTPSTPPRSVGWPLRLNLYRYLHFMLVLDKFTCSQLATTPPTPLYGLVG